MRFSSGELDEAEPLGRQAQHDAGNAAIAHQNVGADADHRQRHLFRQYLQEGDEIVDVMRLEHQLSQAHEA